VPSALVCVRTNSDGVYSGVMLGAGVLTAQAVYGLHCTLGAETLDRKVTATVSMNQALGEGGPTGLPITYEGSGQASSRRAADSP
jgi:hypothetical protein